MKAWTVLGGKPTNNLLRSSKTEKDGRMLTMSSAKGRKTKQNKSNIKHNKHHFTLIMHLKRESNFWEISTLTMMISFHKRHYIPYVPQYPNIELMTIYRPSKVTLTIILHNTHHLHVILHTRAYMHKCTCTPRTHS